MITQETIMEYLNYNPLTGEFTRRKRTSNRINIGDIAGSVSYDGYIRIRVEGRLQLAHRLAWLYVFGEWPNKRVDHINRNRGDNKISNLRLVDESMHRANSKMRSDNTSGSRGVSYDKETGKWLVRIQTDGKSYKLGRFSSLEEASEIYKAKFTELYPSVNTEMRSKK